MNKNINLIEKEIKSIAKSTKLLDPYMLNKFSVAPYRACSHACKYCDGRAEKYYVEGNFETDIVIRKNLPKLMEDSIPKFKEIGFFNFSSGVTDPYQPIEQKTRLTRRCAEVLSKYNLAGNVHTKSALMIEDFDIWKEIAQKSGLHINISLNTLDDDIRKIFEPNASTVSERIELITKAKDIGASVGLYIMPYLPFITDSEEELSRLFEFASQVDIDQIAIGGLTLRAGIQKEVYLETIKNNYPHLYQNYIELYHKNFTSGMPDLTRAKSLSPIISKLRHKHKITEFIPHKVYKNKVPIYDEIYVLLYHMMHLYKTKSYDITKLKIAFESYKQWLISEKQNFNRSRKSNYRILEEKIKFMIETKIFSQIIKNKKLEEFIHKIVFAKSVFDYKTMKLI